MSELYIPLILLFFCSALTSYVATAIVRRAAQRIGLVDEPSEGKFHRVTTPVGGGAAIYLSLLPLLFVPAMQSRLTGWRSRSSLPAPEGDR